MVEARPDPAAPHALRRARPLRPGDRVALFSPSSHAGRQPPEFLEAAREALASLGLEPDPLPQDPPRHLYLAGTDAERAAQFESLYCDPQVRALFATRGGYGAQRILPLLNAERIAAAEPKHVVGMSDVVALFGFLAAAGVGAIHGPCLAAPAHQESPHRGENLEALSRLLFDPGQRPAYDCGILHLPPETPPTLQGRLAGGCLSVLAAGAGTPWAVSGDGAILFLEDVDEAPYRIDRYLTQLRQAGRLEGVRAVVFGHLRNCDGTPPGLLAQVLRDLFREVPFPVLTGLQAGHGALNLALPLGDAAELQFGEAPLPGGAATLQLR